MPQDTESIEALELEVVQLRQRIAELEQSTQQGQQHRVLPEQTVVSPIEDISLRTLFQHSADAIILIGDELMIDCNEAAIDMMGFASKEDLLKLHPSDFSPERQPDGRLSYDKANDMIAAAFKRGHHRFEWIHRRRSGEDFPVEVSLTALPRGDSRIIFGVWTDITERKQAEQERALLQQQVIDSQRATMRELSTPLIPLSAHVVLMPLIGSIDTARAVQVMETLLEGVSTHQARFAILDITGVQVVDTQVANALIHATQAVRLLGAHVVLTGIGPAMAQTLVQLGIDMGDMVTTGSLQTGVAYALAR
jgi:PAS domain S-box-containing protein